MLPNVERRDLSWAARLLRAELVAREEQEAEAACFVLAPERDEPGHLPNISQASDVDDEDHLACENVERDVLARVGPGAQIRERGHWGGSLGVREANTALGREEKQPLNTTCDTRRAHTLNTLGNPIRSSVQEQNRTGTGSGHQSDPYSTERERPPERSLS